MEFRTLPLPIPSGLSPGLISVTEAQILQQEVHTQNAPDAILDDLERLFAEEPEPPEDPLEPPAEPPEP
jgi:hypothetical protein